MRWRSPLTGFFRLRHTLKVLDRLARTQERQTLAIERIADLLAPHFPEPSDEILKDSGLSFSRDREQVLAASYVEKVRKDTGHEPTDLEIATYLDELEART